MATYAILGAGLSGTAVYDFLVKEGAGEISLYVPQEKREEARLAFPHARVNAFGEEINADVVVRSPGIRPDHPTIARALSRGARLTQEVELFLDRCPAPVYAVTGSDGKTTTATLATEMLRAAGHTVWLGGNIGVPLLGEVDEIKPCHRVVLELSSFQLSTFAPRLAGGAITCLTPNHLNWHRDMEEYRSAKRNIFPRATRRVQHASLPLGVDYPSLTFSATYGGANYTLTDGWLCHAETRLASVASVRLRGLYNLENLLCAAALTDAPPTAVACVAESFAGVRHRMEYLGCFDGREVYNSSIDTTPSRTAATLTSVAAPATVVVGGASKNLDSTPLSHALMAHAHRVVFTGQTGDEMRAHLLSQPAYCGSPLTYYEADFAGAVRLALSLTQRGEWLVLSPAATSFDAFSSYEARGDYFRDLVLKYTEQDK